MLHEWLIMFHPTPSHFPYRQPTSLHQSPQGYAKTGERSNKQYYRMRLSMISWIIKNEVCVIPQTLRSVLSHRHEVLIIHDIMRKPNSIIIVLLYCFHIIHPQKQKRSIQPFCFWEHSKGLSNQADVELYMINAISAADIAFIMSSYFSLLYFTLQLMAKNQSSQAIVK